MKIAIPPFKIFVDPTRGTYLPPDGHYLPFKGIALAIEEPVYSGAMSNGSFLVLANKTLWWWDAACITLDETS